MKVIMKKLLTTLLTMLTLSGGFAANLDLSQYGELASGNYDLDTLYNGITTNRGDNLAGIYQVTSDDADMGNIAEIQQSEGVNNVAMIWQNGSGNEGRIYQIGGENNQARLAQLGSGHFAMLTQDGGNDNVMMVQMLGASAVINATQTNASFNVLSVVLNSGSNLTITQSGGFNTFATVMGANTSMIVNQTGQ